ncbi:uncharacterized protein LOC112556525 [Pomacea canaliculata]|uniref:uncharacterized protein LOC112556525 n=1 Tax=Pomacea canaliculata TaxID=400727 RepID=UPI000D72EC12|nr:uncharacterized protein LOC112556525 [Pomacea canaliculata]
MPPHSATCLLQRQSRFRDVQSMSMGALRMQTVITWRRPMETSLYAPSGNPCTYLLGNALCYIISGMMLLVVGVIITSLTFQNLEAYKDENKERYAGPVLIGAGVLVLARGAFSRLRPQRAPSGRRRSFLQRYVREVYNRPILAFRNSASLSLCDIHISGLQDSNSRSRLYSDEPPSYDQVTSDSQVCGPSPLQDTPTPTGVSSATTLHRCAEGTDNIEYVNDEDDVFYIREGDDDLQPPPHYEDFMRASECIRTTRL